MGELATRLARAGTVVFAPTYRSAVTTPDGLTQASQDIVCRYRLAPLHRVPARWRSAPARDRRGMVDGADFVVLGGLSATTATSPGDPCPGDPTPDVVVGISGCYYEHEGAPVTWFDDMSSWGNKDIDFYLLAGDQDTTCPAWQSQRLAAALRAAGYQVTLVELTGADHYALVFHEERDGELRAATNDAAGERAVHVILDAIAARQQAQSKK